MLSHRASTAGNRACCRGAGRPAAADARASGGQPPHARRGGGRAPSRAPASASETVPVAAASYYVVKNVFKVKDGSNEMFENVWKTRESHLKEMPGFIRFAMLRCINVPGKYVSETHWQSESDFKNWASSPSFKKSHNSDSADSKAKRPNTIDMLEGPPVPEFYETVTTTSSE